MIEKPSHIKLQEDSATKEGLYISQQNPYLCYVRIHTLLIYQHLAMTSGD